MTIKVTRFAVALLLGFLLAAYPVIAMSGTSPTAPPCCRNGGHCCNMPCCAAPKTPSAPVHASSQNEWQALSASIISLLTLPWLATNEFPPRFSSLAPVTALPLFQRDCCYLI
jgi:hypothetical protein